MMPISSDIAFRHSLCRPFMLLLACVLSLAVWPPLRAQEKPVGKHIGYNRYGNRLYQVGGQIDVYPRKQLAKLYSPQMPLCLGARQFTTISSRLTSKRYGLNISSTVHTRDTIWKCISTSLLQVPTSRYFFISSVADGLPARPNGWKSFLNIWLLLG